MYATPYKYARLCKVSTQAIYQRIKAGSLVLIEKEDLTGEVKKYIDLDTYPPRKGRRKMDE